MTSTDILSAQGLTHEQEALAQTIVPKVKQWNEYGQKLMLGYASGDTYIHIARPHGLFPADIRASICKKYNALELPYEFESDEGKLVVQRAIMLKDGKKKGEKAPEPIQPPPTVVEEEPEKVPTQEELDNDLILNVAVEIEKLSDQHLALLVSFSEGESPSEELLAQLGLSGLPETDALRILNAAYDYAGKPTPAVTMVEDVQTSDTVETPLPGEDNASDETVHPTSPDVSEPPAAPVVDETATTDSSNSVVEKIANLSGRRLSFLQDAANGDSNKTIGNRWATSSNNVDTTLRQTWYVLRPSEDNTNWRQRLIDLYLANGGQKSSDNKDDPAPQEPVPQTIEDPEPVVEEQQETPVLDEEVQAVPVAEPEPTPTEALALEASALEHEDTPVEELVEPGPSPQEPELTINPELLMQAERLIEAGMAFLAVLLVEVQKRKLKTPDQT